MGRETFLAKVVWEDGWPVVNPGVGMLTDEVEINLPEWKPSVEQTGHYEFAGMEKLGPEFLLLRNPKEDMYRLTGKALELKLQPETLKEKASPSYVAIRQQHHAFSVSARVKVAELSGKECAGIALMQSDEYNLRVEADSEVIKAILCEKGEDTVLGTYPTAEAYEADKESVVLRIEVNGLTASVSLGDTTIGSIPVSALSTEVAGGFVGCTVGMYASANGEQSDKYAAFESFSYDAK